MFINIITTGISYYRFICPVFKTDILWGVFWPLCPVNLRDYTAFGILESGIRVRWFYHSFQCPFIQTL
jgi:hypothetical protein